MDYNALSVKELIGIVRERKLCKGNAAWLVSARKPDVIALLESGTILQPRTIPVGPTTDLAAVIAAAITQHMPVPIVALDETRVSEMIQSAIGSIPVPENKKLDIHNGNRPIVTLEGHQHYQFATLLKILTAKKRHNGSGLNVWIVGPAGSGKTSAASHCAKALALSFYPQSVCAQTPMSALMGYMDAHGNYVRSPLREKFEHGGIFLCDEVDAGNDNVLLCLNAVADNGHCGFPDGLVQRHKDFILIACANTSGNGANRQYSARKQMDAAFLNRFVKLPWNYDEALERELSGNEEFCGAVQEIRARADRLGLRVIVSPRQSIDGTALMDAGFSATEALQMTIFEGLDIDTINKLKGE